MNSPNTWHLLQNATVYPPVTVDTLKELDLQWIQNNINLRVDVHYDYDLHFMPISGRRGEEKRIEAHKYWRALEFEFRIYQHNGSDCCPLCRQQAGSTPFTFTQRLPVMFRTLRALLLILVPNNDHQFVRDEIDVKLLMQQVRKGALDALKLCSWLSSLLTTHCAPIRDEWAREMTRKVSEGVNQNDMAFLVAGLEKLFSLCEAMKLDVANHQIRTFRLPLIGDGVSFQRDYFQSRIRQGKLDLYLSQQWFRSAKQQSLAEYANPSEHSAIIFGLASLCIEASTDIPEIFKYDAGRIQQLREETSDLTHIQLCWDYLAFRTNQGRGTTFQRPFGMRLLDLTDGESGHEAGSSAIWSSNLDAISVEVTRVCFSMLQSQTTISAADVAITKKELGVHFATQLQPGLLSTAGQLQSKVENYINHFRTLSALQISDSQQQYQHWRQTQLRGRHVPDLEDIARRIAHIAVIHWWVWKDLAYVSLI